MSNLARGRMVSRIVATLAATGLLAACGLKGPLYLPPEQDSNQGQTQSAPPDLPKGDSASPLTR